MYVLKLTDCKNGIKIKLKTELLKAKCVSHRPTSDFFVRTWLISKGITPLTPAVRLLTAPSITSWRWIIQLPRGGEGGGRRGGGVVGPLSAVKDPAEVRVMSQTCQSALHVWELHPDNWNGRWSQACLDQCRLAVKLPATGKFAYC